MPKVSRDGGSTQTGVTRNRNLIATPGTDLNLGTDGGIIFDPRRSSSRRISQSILTSTFGPFTATAGINVMPVNNETVIKDGVTVSNTAFDIVVPDLPVPCQLFWQAMLRIPAASLSGGTNGVIGVATASGSEITEFDLDRLGILPFNPVGTSDVENYFSSYVEYPAHTPATKQMFIGANDGVPNAIFPSARACSIIVAGAWGRAFMSLWV